MKQKDKVTDPIFEIKDLSFWYGQNKALDSITFDIQKGDITAIIGPSGCGKSTLLRCLNRMNDLIEGVRVEGDILFEGQSIYKKNIDLIMLRKRVGMVFQKSNPFPKSIYENVAFGPRIHGVKNKNILDEIVEKSLRDAALWDEVKDRLHHSALKLSGGQQQRLCIARAIAVDPEVILFDEPCSALDPVASAKIEELMLELKGKYTQVIVTHNMQQASRVSDWTAFLLMGKMIEFGPTEQIFLAPRNKITEEYVTGRFG